jgi:hypothetical protein
MNRADRRRWSKRKGRKATEAKTFKCALCGETFAKAWSDAEADAEQAVRFPSLTNEARVLVCDDCDGLLIAFVEATGATPL